MTVSMTWMTPFEASMSVFTTLASFTFTLSRASIRTLCPCTVCTLPSFTTSFAMTLPVTTWYVRTLVSFALSASNASRVPGASFANASSVGANTVYGPGPFSVSTRPASVSARASVVKLPASTAVSTISFPAPAVVVAGRARPTMRPSTPMATVNRTNLPLFISSSS
jgi:hypothetical protein